MKYVVIGAPSPKTREEIMEVYPRHKMWVDKFVSNGEVIGIGPFSDFGSMAIFKTKRSAEEFVSQDPFILEGIIANFEIKEWNDILL